MKFDHVLVNVGLMSQTFNFEYYEETSYGQACRINSAGKEAIIDENFAVILSNMPDHWLEAAISKLKELLAKSE